MNKYHLAVPLPPLFLINGPPAAGKTTLSRALMARFEHSIHLPVDDIRDWVVGGLATPLDWTDETAMQFRLAEESAAEMARRYREAGFAVAFDHCRFPSNLDWLHDGLLGGPPVYRILLTSSLESNLARNLSRTNKDFDPSVLESTIRGLQKELAAFSTPSAWIVMDNEPEGIEDAVDRLLKLTIGR